MLVRILNTLRSRIWDMVLFLFSDYLNLRFNSMECARRLWSSGKLNFKGLTLKLLSFQHKSLICYSYLMENFSLVNSHSLLGNPHLPIQDLDTDFIWSQKAENQKFNIEENVMSERVKMPNRHFLRSDYLHIFFYIKFLVFVSLVSQISILSFLKLFVGLPFLPDL